MIELRTVPIPLDTIAVRATRTGLFGLVATRGVALLPHEPRPVHDGIVEVLDTPYRTGIGRDGRFSFPQLGEGSYSVLVRVDRYQARMVPVYVPSDGGVEVTIVVDSTYADYQRRDDYLLRDISRRLREATNPSALVNLHELAAPEGTSLADVLRVAPSALRRGLVLKADVTCVWIEARPRPRMTAADILASEVQAVEVYGLFANGRTMAPPAPWPSGSPCGTGPPPLGLQPPDNVARHIVVWLRRGR